MTIFCKTKAKSVKLRIETGIASLPLVAFTVTAQVPSSITGKSFGIGITGGTSPFAGSGYYLFRPASSGNRYQVIGIYNVANSSGTYSYSLINSTTGSIQISDSIVGASTVYVGFSDANTAGYAIKPISTGGFQIGHFELLPSLQISRSGNQIALSWPTNAVGFTMEYAANLPATSWISNSSSPAIVSGQYTVTNTISDNARFYRLQKP